MVVKDKVCDLAGYTRLVRRLYQEWDCAARGGFLWFRGHFESFYDLRPSALRKNCDHLSMFEMFRAEAPPHLENIPDTPWEWYFAAQHYGVPTLLLDWTEDPLAALYFSVRDVFPENKEVEHETCTPHVWLLDAAHMNEVLYDNYELFVPYEGKIDPWLPNEQRGSQWRYKGRTYSSRYPIAVYPIRRTKRIAAQRGCFTVHGTDVRPLDEQVGSEVRIAKIEIVDRKGVEDELRLLAIDKYRYFPEAPMLAEHIAALCPAPSPSSVRKPSRQRSVDRWRDRLVRVIGRSR